MLFNYYWQTFLLSNDCDHVWKLVAVMTGMENGDMISKNKYKCDKCNHIKID